MKIIYIISQVMLGIVFIISAFLKIIDIQIFVTSLQLFDFLSEQSVELVAILVIILELTVGYSLISNIYGKLGLILAIILLGLFGMIGIYSIIFNKDWICACLGSLFLGKFSLSTIVRDFILLIMAAFTYYFRTDQYSFKVPFIVSLLVSSIIIFTALYLYDSYKINTSKTVEYKIGNKIKSLTATSINNEHIDISNQKYPYVLLIFFDVKKDCSFCLTEFPIWRDIYENYKGKIQVIGVGYAPSEKFMYEWANARKLKFPIIWDNDKNLITQYNFSTPMKVLVNKENEIVAMQKSTGNPDLQNIFINEIENIVYNN